MQKALPMSRRTLLIVVLLLGALLAVWLWQKGAGPRDTQRGNGSAAGALPDIEDSPTPPEATGAPMEPEMPRGNRKVIDGVEHVETKTRDGKTVWVPAAD